MPRNVVPFACPACGEERLLERDGAVWACQVCGKHGRRPARLEAPTAAPGPSGGPPARPAASSLEALVSVVLQRHLTPGPGPVTVVACAPLAQWPRGLQRELTATLGALPESVVLVLERGPR